MPLRFSDTSLLAKSLTASFDGVSTKGILTSGSLSVPWTPADLGASLALWLDAEDASTITLNGSTVSQWNDKSLRGINLSQATASAQPTYTPNDINGKPVLFFDGVADQMSSVAVTPFFPSAGKNVFSVVRFRNTTTGLQSVYATDITATAPAVYLQADLGTVKGYNGAYVSGGTYTANQIDLTGLVQIGGGNLTMYRNGILTATGTTATALTNNGFKIGKLSSFGNFPFVNIGEIVAVDGNISTENRQRAEGYLAHKWGLTANLPANHPYKSAAPTV
jgi:hypothetical protein